MTCTTKVSYPCPWTSMPYQSASILTIYSNRRGQFRRRFSRAFRCRHPSRCRRRAAFKEEEGGGRHEQEGQDGQAEACRHRW